MMLPFFCFPTDPQWLVPDEAACTRLWDQYAMAPHIRAHCGATAEVAMELAGRAQAKGAPVVLDAVRAAALLHDIAKAYTIRYGGDHAQLGAA
jgi:putative nucleotidyltransferase with HDIG domain